MEQNKNGCDQFQDCLKLLNKFEIRIARFVKIVPETKQSWN
jgi:hypothetical protein